MKKICLAAASCILLLSVFQACTTRESLQQKKEQAEASRNLGEAYLREGKYSAALRELSKAEVLAPEDYFLQFDLGLAYLYKGEVDRAIEHFKKSLAIKDNYGPARNSLGNAYLEKRQWDKAIEQYKIAVSNLLYATPQFPYSNLGFAYYHKQEYKLSEKYFKEALEITPEFDRALYGLARTYIATGRIPEAIKQLEFAVDKHPDNASLHFELAKAYQMNRDYQKAYGSYLRVIQIDPDSSLADQALSAAQRIRPLL